MKIIINATNQIEDRPLREVDRLITSGKGHLPEVVKTVDEYFKSLPNKDFSNKPNRDKPVEITFEDLDDIAIFREPVTEIDVIEPIPIDKYVDFAIPKKMSLLKKLRNKII